MKLTICSIQNSGKNIPNDQDTRRPATTIASVDRIITKINFLLGLWEQSLLWHRCVHASCSLWI